MSSSTGQQQYSNLSSNRLARYQSYITIWETRLLAVQAQMTALLSSPVESYNFNAGEGSQQASRRKLQVLADEENRCIRMIDKYNAIINGGGLVNLNMRRK